MRTFKTITLILLILLFSGEIMAGGYGVSGVGIRALSMAGAFRAVADDWSAAYYNPAGLVNLLENQLAFGADFYNHRPEFTPDVTKGGYSFGYYDGQQRVPHDQIAYTPYASGIIILPMFENVSAGLAIFEPFDFASEWDIFRLSPTYNDFIEDTSYLPVEEARVPFPDYSHRMNLDVIDFHPTIAAQLMEDKLSLGFGFSIRRGSYLHNQIVLIPNELPEPYSSRPYDYLVQMSELDADGWGFGFNLGLLYNINEKITFGASYQSKTTISLSGDATSRFYAPGNVNVFNSTDAGSDEQAVFDTINFVHTAIHDVDADWTLPSEFGFGLSYQVSEKVLAAVDFAYTLWSEYDDIIMKINSSEGLGSVEFINNLMMPANIINRWDNAFRVSIGVEGRPDERFTLRGGYSFDQSPIPAENATVAFHSPADRHYLSGGGSIFFGQVELSGAAQLIISPEETVTGLEDLNDDGVFDNLGGAYSNVAFVTSFGITIRF
jgi:long-chain fatty acid transport protein